MSGAWKLVFPDIVKSDFAALAVPVRAQVLKMINRVATNPLPQARVVYALREIDGEMVVVIVGMREENTVYALAARRRIKLGL